jgi:hypothetical protein
LVGKSEKGFQRDFVDIPFCPQILAVSIVLDEELVRARDAVVVANLVVAEQTI